MQEVEPGLEDDILNPARVEGQVTIRQQNARTSKVATPDNMLQWRQMEIGGQRLCHTLEKIEFPLVLQQSLVNLYVALMGHEL